MTVDAERVFRASMQCLPDAVAFIETHCQHQGIAANDVLRLNLIIEELFTNTVLHGHGGDSDAQVRIGLSVGPTQVAVVYEDAGPHFDPLAQLPRSATHLDAPIDERPAGGFGIALVAMMSSSLSYVREDGLNRLRLTLPRESQARSGGVPEFKILPP